MKAFMYISRAVNAGTASWMPHDYTSILKISNANNARHKVNGFLGYQSGYFLQYLEGPEAGIERLLVSILNDDRHADIHVLLNGKIAAPNFKNWRVPLGNRLMRDAAFRTFAKRYQHYFANQSEEHTKVLSEFHVYDSLTEKSEFDYSADVALADSNDSALYLLAV